MTHHTKQNTTSISIPTKPWGCGAPGLRLARFNVVNNTIPLPMDELRASGFPSKCQLASSRIAFSQLNSEMAPKIGTHLIVAGDRQTEH
jgi:hypothetical protein